VAREVKVGDAMFVMDPEAASATDSAATAAGGAAALSFAHVSRISRWRGGIINPLTHSGRVLAANPAANSRSSSPTADPSGKPKVTQVVQVHAVPAKAFILASTVFASPGNALKTMASMPSLFKLGSILFPNQLQESIVVEFAASVVAGSTLMLQSALGWCKNYGKGNQAALALILAVADTVAYCVCVLGFVLFDLTIGAGFLVYHTTSYMLQLPGAAAIVAVALLAACPWL